MRLISCVLTFYALMEGCNTQFDLSQLFNQQPPQPPNYAYQSIPQNNYYGNNQEMVPYLMNAYNYEPQCDCSCDKCQNLISCCAEFCSKCGPSNPAIYLYPYPYIVVASPPTTVKATTTEEPTTPQPTTTEVTTTTKATTTTAATTTTEVTTTTVATSIYPEDGPPFPEEIDPPLDAIRRSGHSLPNNFLKGLIYDPSEPKQDNGNIILTALRRTKPRWMPQFGIVPIPDRIAEKLMLRIRHMKVLHPEEDTMRRTDPIHH